MRNTCFRNIEVSVTWHLLTSAMHSHLDHYFSQQLRFCLTPSRATTGGKGEGKFCFAIYLIPSRVIVTAVGKVKEERLLLYIGNYSYY